MSTPERASRRSSLLRGGDADEILRDSSRHSRALRLGRDLLRRGRRARSRPAGRHAGRGQPDAGPGHFQGDRIAALAVDDAPEEDRMFLERVADLVAGHCLVGWDTGGEPWEP